MDLYYDDQKVASLPVTGVTTIGELKRILRDWLHPQGITNYSVRLFFNNNSELSPVVFTGNDYDAMNFAAQANLLPGGSIKVNTLPSPAKVAKAPSPKQELSIKVPSPAKVAKAPSSVRAGVTYTSEQLSKMKNQELKDILKGLGSTTTGNKQDLIDRILAGGPPKASKGRPRKAGSPKASPEKSPKVKTPEASPMKPLVPIQPLTGLAPLAGVPPVSVPAALSPLEELGSAVEGSEDVVYLIRDENDNYNAFRTREAALRWWIETEVQNTNVEYDEIGLSDPPDFEDSDEQELIEQTMEDEGYDLLEVPFFE